MFQITIFFLYLTAGIAFGVSRLPRYAPNDRLLLTVAFMFTLTGLLWHGALLLTAVVMSGGAVISLANTVSVVGLQLALIAIIGAIEPTLRGLAGGLLLLAAAAASLTITQGADIGGSALSWQLQAHILISLFAYGLLSVGALVAVYALVQDSRLRSGHLSSVNRLFAPLETNEKLLYGIALGGFSALLIGVLSGLTFVDDLFAQHLVHKSTLSIVALILFGVLLAGRGLAGWRGRQAVYLYLCGFLILGLAYFGSRYVLEDLLGRSWG